QAALSEAYRVLRPGGRFFCLEFSHPITEGLQKIYDAYSFNVIPKLGEIVAKDRESYQYLVESIRKFPGQEGFATRIKRCGFARVKYENLSAGIAAIHSGWRI
ncbi:class I SAM-dependent methyltransferase, partial [Hyphococcus sp.]|uniref:class I SAM-dependent methyltransferase n=1 Tax=Hyphococcus sp. TaxID=2038636 RepID=UPI003753C3F4